VALGYGVGAAAVSAGAHIATASGLNLKAKDPSLVEPLVIYAIALQLGVVLAAPQIAFPFLANLFTVFAFGMIWLTLRDSIVVWTLGIAGTAAVFYVAQARIGIPIASDFQLTLVWLYFSLILGRCLLLSVTANRMRAQLASGRRKLAESLVQVEILASRDELTGALNRRSLMAALERERAHAERSGVSLSVAMIDLDHFKRVNDTYGHAAGDEVLRTLAATVHETMRTTDVFGRYGGEEFMMILVGSAPELALGAMERIRNVLAAKTWPTIAPEFSVTLSAGIACHRKGESGEALLHRADKALYQAKDAGRNTIITSSP
ncbi:MAG: GGDEF domain-containing protein, partial [Sulfuritalea sp.]|nr:GGDEF domain-containing protein [Sulfuritalea sp.]